ncbi:hypothetical protein [Streptomyces misionensis]|uniref:hypothetical protein n=1 Tax=Streptomyces misionensis TaxID=67331 RepID=UPI0033BDA6B1
MHALTLAAGLGGGKLLGTITVVGIAGGLTIMFIAGLRGSDTIKIDNKKKALVWGFIIGQLWMAAGGTLAEIGQGVHQVSTSVLGGSGLLGSSPGQGGVCFILFAIAYAFPWRQRLVWPALCGLAIGVGAVGAGGIWSIAANVAHMLLSALVTKVM